MSGIMPFDDDCRSRLYTHIITANYVYYPQFWSGSDQAKHFVDCLLETSSEHRPTAREALHHHWVTGERPKGLSRREKAPRRDWAFKGVEDGGTTVIGDNNDADEDAESNVNGTTVQRVSG
jgi:serine/threonine protein kinase